jgi:ankyrin repeat protein
MLAVARSDENLECVKYLLQKGANYKVEDEYGNNLHHIAAINGNIKILDYLAKNLKIELFSRNGKGETPLSICQQMKNQEGI